MGINGKNDAELVRKSLVGCKKSFAALYDRYSSLAMLVAIKIVTDQHLAEDLVQESFLQAHLSLYRLKNHKSFKSWLLAIVLNVCKKHLRDRKIDFFSVESVYGGIQIPSNLDDYLKEDPLYLAERKQLAELVSEAVNLLSPAMRKTTLLYYYQNFDLAEIASVLGVSNNVVRTRLHRARVCLRTYLSKAFAKNDIEIMSPQRSKKMMQVEILDVMHSENSDAILIMDKARTKILPIFVGKEAGMSIAIWKKAHEMPRPCTYELMANLLDAVKVEVEHVRVESIKEGIFYAVVRLKHGEDVAEVDARPSDAINLALRTDSPIFTTEEVMELAVEAPPEAKEGLFESPGIDQLAKEMEVKHKKRHVAVTGERKNAGEEYIKALFKTAKDK